MSRPVPEEAEVTVRLFASLRQTFGSGTAEVAVEPGATVELCWERLCQRCPELGRWRGSVRPALNQGYVDWDRPVAAGDELAFLPPVSGGLAASGRCCWVGPEPVHLDALISRLPRSGVGALATFLGVVRSPDEGRDVASLDYEAYAEMAEIEITVIIEEALASFQAHRALVQHRTGKVQAGEPSVAVVTCAPHRHQALDACTYIIDQLKLRAPIWKVGS